MNLGRTFSVEPPDPVQLEEDGQWSPNPPAYFLKGNNSLVALEI